MRTIWKKIGALIITTILISFNVYAAQNTGMYYADSIDTPSVLLPKDIKSDKATEKAVRRGDFFAEADLIITDEGNGNIGAFAVAYMDHAVDEVYITIYLDRWNEEEEEIITKNGETQINEEINLLEGNNILTVTIVDMRAREEEYTKEFKEDTTIPQIALGTSDDGTKIKITAKDTVALSYITYQWDDGEVQTITPQPGSEAQIEQEIEALSGSHKLTVTAVNTSNKTATKTQEVQGSTKPLAGARVEDRAHIVFYATDNDGLANLKFTINGQEYILPGEGSPKELEYVFEVIPGHYSMTVTAENIYGLEADTQEFVYDY